MAACITSSPPRAISAPWCGATTPIAIATRFDAEPEEEVSVVGCLCTPLDRLADQVLLPRAEPGDLVAMFCAGAYGASASPSAFLGHGPAREVLV